MFRSLILFFVLIISAQIVFAQPAPINRQQFFLGDSIVNVQLTTDIRGLRTGKSKPMWQSAHIEMNFADTLVINENIKIEPRGSYRKENCDLASLMLNFNTSTSPLLSNLKKLKLVGGCHDNFQSEDLLLREYLIYKIYNMLSPMSFRVRLLHITYNDSRQKMKPYSQYAFLIEDIKDIAGRNNCKEVKNKVFNGEGTNRQSITFVSIFEFMIGNTDWSIPNYHNIKLMVPRNDTLARPYLVPYDFDYCGLVNAPYATPREDLDIKTVRDRYYLGYERTIEELQQIVSVFKDKQSEIMQYINSFTLLRLSSKKDILNYLDQFYNAIKNDSGIKYTFISNAIH
ncbi:MAG: hypothetical protein JO072_05515 [Parafilimonas sp.]|nr:hypothetical protein [Parafilimonas sp.]